jgi:Tfp pilus assembly PilM family ATPase
MNAVSMLIERLRGLEVERLLGLRPPYPPVALQLDHGAVGLVRLARRRRGRPLLEAHVARPVSADNVPASIFERPSVGIDELAEQLRKLFELSGTRPGRVSLVLPDNLAKITLLTLPERPGSRKQLTELVRAQMRRAVPFKLDEATIDYQLLPAQGRGVSVLVVLVRRSLVESYEQALERIGARIGLVDLCTTNLLNLCRDGMSQAAAGGGDVALLNCTPQYFSLAILREGRLIFLRCKTLALGDVAPGGSNGTLAREITSSLSYYEEKLAGRGVAALFVRSVGGPLDEVGEKLRRLGLANVQRVDPLAALTTGEGVQLDAESGQWIAPAIGAAVGRGR